MEAQSLSVKRAQVEFHNFASLGEPDRAARVYAEENARRGSLLSKHLAFAGPLSPFLEIGANAGHTSYMLCNEYNAEGFALDISADALRHGIALQDRWGLARAPVRVAGDALNLPFADNSLQMVCAFQMLSQFMNIESVFLEVKRVLAPGGVFYFAEEPLKRLLTLSLYRAPYLDTMRPWERSLYEQGLLGYIVQDVIGAHQEESFGIRQNHSMYLRDWRRLIEKHFASVEYEVFVRSHGWGESSMRSLARRFDRHGSDWVPARLLGGTLAAFCKKAGAPPNEPLTLTASNATSAAPIATAPSPATPPKPSAAPRAATTPPTKAASTTSSKPPTARSSTPATATTSSTSPSPATKPNSATAGTTSKASSATNTAGSAPAPPPTSAAPNPAPTTSASAATPTNSASNKAPPSLSPSVSTAAPNASGRSNATASSSSNNPSPTPPNTPSKSPPPPSGPSPPTTASSPSTSA
ncbi:MAG: methyltransferase domain-containing protein [Bryobacterales bacterium]|nr:methyltransferase domain-containing protein [Bryobacterales bacterium]